MDEFVGVFSPQHKNDEHVTRNIPLNKMYE